MNNIINGLVYTLGWFLCVWLAGRGELLWATLSIFAVVGGLFFLIRRSGRIPFYQDLLIVPCALVLALLMESCFIASRIVTYPGGYGWLPPLWLLGLHALFILTLNHSFQMLNRYPLVALLVGFLGAPLSYRAGQALDADRSFMGPLSLRCCLYQ